MTLAKLCHLGRKSYDAKCKTTIGPACSLCEAALRRAAAHGTVCGACFNDVCMRFMGLAMFLFINFNHFLLQ